MTIMATFSRGGEGEFHVLAADEFRHVTGVVRPDLDALGGLVGVGGQQEPGGGLDLGHDAVPSGVRPSMSARSSA